MKTLSNWKLLAAFHIFALSIALTAPAAAEIVTFDLDSIPVPTGAQGNRALPYDEDGLRLTGNTNSIYITGPISAFYPGKPAMIPAPLSSGQDIVMGLHNPAGRLFALRSVTLHPRPAGTAVNVTFTGWLNGNGQMQSQSTGTALAGNTVTFNSNFNRLSALGSIHHPWKLLALPLGGLLLVALARALRQRTRAPIDVSPCRNRWL